MSCEFLVGDPVFIFSETLDEVIPGIIEGFNDRRTVVKVLQETPDGLIRHIVSWINVFKEISKAEEAQISHKKISRMYVDNQYNYRSGMTVHIKQSGSIVKDQEGNPLVYQITRVYSEKRKVSLVNSYGESVGTFSFSDIEYFSPFPLFKESDYHLGQLVSWVEDDSVYEGVISNLKAGKAEVSCIKKLYPLDKKKWLPYYKLQSEDLYDKKNLTILASIIGDTIDSE